MQDSVCSIHVQYRHRRIDPRNTIKDCPHYHTKASSCTKHILVLTTNASCTVYVHLKSPYKTSRKLQSWKADKHTHDQRVSTPLHPRTFCLIIHVIVVICHNTKNATTKLHTLLRRYKCIHVQSTYSKNEAVAHNGQNNAWTQCREHPWRQIDENDVLNTQKIS